MLSPSPTTVYDPPRDARVLDGGGRVVQVSGRGALSGEPIWLALEGVRHRLVAWAGPWPADEHWWDPSTARRRARLQLVAADGHAWIAVVQAGVWRVEAAYD